MHFLGIARDNGELTYYVEPGGEKKVCLLDNSVTRPHHGLFHSAHGVETDKNDWIALESYANCIMYIVFRRTGSW